MALPFLTKKYLFDLAERVGATAAEAAIGILLTEAANWPVWVAVPIATAGAAIKGAIARWIGKKNSASVLPRALDPEPL